MEEIASTIDKDVDMLIVSIDDRLITYACIRLPLIPIMCKFSLYSGELWVPYISMRIYTDSYGTLHGRIKDKGKNICDWAWARELNHH